MAGGGVAVVGPSFVLPLPGDPAPPPVGVLPATNRWETRKPGPLVTDVLSDHHLLQGDMCLREVGALLHFLTRNSRKLQGGSRLVVLNNEVAPVQGEVMTDSKPLLESWSMSPSHGTRTLMPSRFLSSS